MKKWITLTAILFATGVFAQEKTKDLRNKTDHKAEKMKMFEKLNLTDQQKAEITTLFEEQKAERME